MSKFKILICYEYWLPREQHTMIRYIRYVQIHITAVVSWFVYLSVASGETKAGVNGLCFIQTQHIHCQLEILANYYV